MGRDLPLRKVELSNGPLVLMMVEVGRALGLSVPLGGEVIDAVPASSVLIVEDPMPLDDGDADTSPSMLGDAVLSPSCLLTTTWKLWAAASCKANTRDRIAHTRTTLANIVLGDEQLVEVVEMLKSGELLHHGHEAVQHVRGSPARAE